MNILGFAGYSGVGKTTLIERLIPRFTRKGMRVSLVKDAHENFDVDKPGKDSFRFREAGAGEVMLVSSRRWALLHERGGEPEAPLDEHLSRLGPCDLILVEGFRASPIPKIEVYRPALGKPRFQDRRLNIIALACDAQSHAQDSVALPQLDLNDPDEIAGFILNHLGLVNRRAHSATCRVREMV